MKREERKAVHTIKTIDGISIPITQVVATYVETNEIFGEAMFFALVIPGNDEAYRYFNPDRTKYPNFVNPLPGVPREFLLKHVRYPYKEVFTQKQIDDELASGDGKIDAWVTMKATPTLKKFNKEIAANLPLVAKEIIL